MRSGRINIIGFLIAIAVIVGGVWLYTFGPYYWDHREMNEVVKATARYWLDMSEEAARRRLADEMYNRNIPQYIKEDMCEFSEDGPRRTVRCEWKVTVRWPLIGKEKLLHFVSEATALPGGRFE